MRYALAFLLLLCSAFASAASKGFCPQMPSTPSHFVPAQRGESVPPQDGAEYVGTITVFSVISDKGFVCDAKVLSEIDSQVDKKAVAAARAWHFTPAEKDVRAVPVVATFGVSVWRKDDEVFFQQAGQPSHE